MMDLNQRISNKQQRQQQQQAHPPRTSPPSSPSGRIKRTLRFQPSSSSPVIHREQVRLQQQLKRCGCINGLMRAPRWVFLFVTTGLVFLHVRIFWKILLAHNDNNTSDKADYTTTTQALLAFLPSRPRNNASSETTLLEKAEMVVGVSSSTGMVSINNNQRLPTNKHKPILYINIGPYKTGSSFIQCALSRNGYDVLQQDNYLYLGTCPYLCLRRVNNVPSDTEYEFCLAHSATAVMLGNYSVEPRLRFKLDELRRDGTRNALLVWEYFSDIKEKAVQNFMAALDGWDVRVIVHYRRLFEWMPSMYSQLHRPMHGREQYKIWPGDVFYRKRKDKRVRGVERLPFDIYAVRKKSTVRAEVNPRYITVLKKLKEGIYPVQMALDVWRKYVTNVTIIDMHHLTHVEGGRGDPLLMHLFCHVIPSLHHTCEAVKRNEIEILDHGRNERFDSENYDMLGLYAHKLGLHPNGRERIHRTVVWELIRKYQEDVLNKTSKDFPLKCMSNESLEMLWNYSVSAELASLGRGLEAEHRESFDRALREGRFCHIDTNLTLAQPDWLDFFGPFAVAAPHVLERDSKGHWNPSLKEANRIKPELFMDQFGRQRIHSMDRLGFLGFLTIRGTKLASFVTFLRRPKEEVAGEFVSYLDYESYKKTTNGNPQQPPADLACIFGYQMEADVAHPVAQTQKWRCPETNYSRLVYKWIGSLPHMHTSFEFVDEYPIISNSSVITELQVFLTTVVMVRDPLDRLVWLYAKSRQNEVKQQVMGQTLPGDLEGWLELLGSDRKLRNELIRDQYLSLASKPSRAISIVSGVPRTMVLIHECFNLSMLILSEWYPSLIDEDTVDAFLSKSSAKDALSDFEGSLDLQHLRRQARSWFEDDYMFYDAAVAQFRRFLAASDLEDSETDECRRKLG